MWYRCLLRLVAMLSECRSLRRARKLTDSFRRRLSRCRLSSSAVVKTSGDSPGPIFRALARWRAPTPATPIHRRRTDLLRSRVLARERGSKGKGRVQNRTHIESVRQYTTYCQAGRLWQAASPVSCYSRSKSARLPRGLTAKPPEAPRYYIAETVGPFLPSTTGPIFASASARRLTDWLTARKILRSAEKNVVSSSGESFRCEMLRHYFRRLVE
jgi:hypothetical protein